MSGRSPLGFVATLALLLLASGLQAQGAGDIISSERHLRSCVRKSIMPDYPNEALKAEARGVVIAAVVFDENGDLSTVDVLEAPHPSIKQAITEALLQWKTGRYGTDSGPKRLVGWLSFECEIKDGVGHIGYTRRTDDDNQPDKRYRHPHVCCDPRTPFYYCYQGGRP